MARSNTLHMWLIGAGAVAAGGAASADVLHDSLRTITMFPPTYRFGDHDGVYNSIGAGNVYGFPVDVQAADDFSLSGAHTIDRVAVDLFGMSGGVVPSGVLVEFFSDSGGRPAGAAHHSMTLGAAQLSHETIRNWGQFGNGNSPGIRLSVDLSGAGVTLGAGTWWVSIVPISDDDLFSAFRVYEQATGAPVHFRHGGPAHGTGHAGLEYGTAEWALFGGPDGVHPDFNGGTRFGQDGDLAMRIEGTVVPAPGAAGLLGLGLVGLNARRRRTPAVRRPREAAV